MATVTRDFGDQAVTVRTSELHGIPVVREIRKGRTRGVVNRELFYVDAVALVAMPKSSRNYWRSYQTTCAETFVAAMARLRTELDRK